MSQTEYVLHNTEDQRELDRLRALAAVFDPASQRRLRSTGFTHGWRCLEVGAGAGSVASWMASVSGLSGHTTAIDIHTRFLPGLSSGVRGVAGDMRTAALEPESFDLVHARDVLTHRPDVEVALERMLVALRQGGWLVLEEPDCTAARAIAGDKQARHSVAKVNGAILCMFSATGTDPSVGARLPGLLQKAGLKNLGVEYDAPLAQGTSEIAQMMGMSARQLQAKCLATGEATQQDIANYGKFAQSPVSWAIYYATVGVLGQRGGSNSPTQSARPRVEGTSWQ